MVPHVGQAGDALHAAPPDPRQVPDEKVAGVVLRRHVDHGHGRTGRRRLLCLRQGSFLGQVSRLVPAQAGESVLGDGAGHAVADEDHVFRVAAAVFQQELTGRPDAVADVGVAAGGKAGDAIKQRSLVRSRQRHGGLAAVVEGDNAGAIALAQGSADNRRGGQPGIGQLLAEPHRAAGVDAEDDIGLRPATLADKHAQVGLVDMGEPLLALGHFPERVPHGEVAEAVGYAVAPYLMPPVGGEHTAATR